MPSPFDDLRERLLHGGIAPRHVRRYLRELHDHLDDLRAEEQSAGRSKAESEAAALARLGSTDQLARAMLDQPGLQSWSARAPWAVFGLAPVALLAAAWSVALLLLWSGWRIFLPGATTPFVSTQSFATIYFGLGRLLFFGAPVFIGWSAVSAALRQRLSIIGPLCATFVVACIASAARVHAVRVGGAEHVGLSFGLGLILPRGPVSADPLAWCVSGALTYVALILCVAMLPYLLWRLRLLRFA